MSCQIISDKLRLYGSALDFPTRAHWNYCSEHHTTIPTVKKSVEIQPKAKKLVLFPFSHRRFKTNNQEIIKTSRRSISLSMASEGEKPLKKIADAFEGIAPSASSKTSAMEVASFSHACAQVSVLFGCLGIAFKFAEKDYTSKVEDLIVASKSISTLQSLVELDVQHNSVRNGGSHSRNLLRVIRGLDMVRVLFEQILVSQGNSLRDPASVAYAKVFAPHHGWAIRKAVGAGLYALPSKSQLLRKLNEDEASAKVQMQKYVTSSGSVIHYVEELFLSRELGIDW